MKKAALFGKFSQDYLNNTVTPNLREYGIEVLKVATKPKHIRLDTIRQIDCIIFLRDRTQHGKDFEPVVNLARRHGVPVVNLSRSVSVWPEVLAKNGFTKTATAKPKTVRPPPPPRLSRVKPPPEPTKPAVVVEPKRLSLRQAVPEKLLDEMLRVFIEARRQGFTYPKVTPLVAKYWENKPLKDEKHLHNFIASLLKSDQCPKFFKEYMETEDRKPRVARTRSDDDNFHEELVAEYDKEVAELTEKISKLEGSVEQLTQKVREAETERDRFKKMKSKDNVPDKLSEVLQALNTLVKTQHMSHKEAWETLVKGTE